ncbi:MAG: hypothetical protein RSD63_07325 [Eubacterium sp.]
MKFIKQYSDRFLGVFLSIVVLISVIMPENVNAMIFNPGGDIPQKEENSPSCQALEEWYVAHKDTGGTYTLTEDVVVNNALCLQPTADMTLLMGDFHLYVRGTGLAELYGSHLFLEGTGGSEGLIYADAASVVILDGPRITATNGTALVFGPGEDSPWETYLGGNYTDAPTTITAYGENACGIDSRFNWPLTVSHCDVTVNGNGSTGIKALQNITFRDCNVVAQGEAVFSQTGTIVLDCTLTMPEVSGAEIIDYQVIEILPNDLSIAPFTPFEKSGAPKYITVMLQNPEDKYDVRQALITVEWDIEAFNAQLNGARNFTINGVAEKRPSMNFEGANSPVLNVSIRESKPITDLELMPHKNGEPSYFTLSFEKPKGADDVILQTSTDGGKSFKDESIRLQIESEDGERGTYQSVFKETNHYYYRLKVIGSSYAGYSNRVDYRYEKPPIEEEDVEGNRSGGGRDKPQHDQTLNVLDHLLKHDYVVDGNSVHAFGGNDHKTNGNRQDAVSLEPNQTKKGDAGQSSDTGHSSDISHSPDTDQDQSKGSKTGTILLSFGLIGLVFLGAFFIKRS